MFEPRINVVRQKLLKEKLDGVLISSVFNISYLSGFTNFSEIEREAYMFIGKDFAYIITDARYSEAVKKQVPHLTFFERSHQKPIKDLFKKHQKEVKQLGIEEDNLTVAEHKVLKNHFKSTKHFDVGYLRSIKTENEISKIEKACRIGDLAFDFILKKISKASLRVSKASLRVSKACDLAIFKTGIAEKELAGELENFIRSQGAVFSFPPIIAFGKNSSVPHHQTGSTKLTGNGEFVLLDFGVKFENHCSDMTRTIFFGKPTGKQKEIYGIVLAAQQKAVDYINSAIKNDKSIKAAEVDKVARDYIVSQGYPTIPHSLGHGVGLEVHESPGLSPKSKAILKEGMVFSIEPGIYIPDFGGVRIEDLFVLENKGLRQITHSSKQIISVKI
ncbi:MAG: Xaa-Pro peptidase family protein [Candidatus Daviesbacteria bacterium]|nr:Xaa-Pro peptidase family protein [Candidatus Daviesbacteria bacterium]